MNIWQGTSDDFSNSAYWTDGIPTADDILVLSGTPVQPPSPPPPVGPPVPNPLPVTPPSPTNSNVSLTFPTSGGANYLSSYAGIRILNGYTGTATFPANVGFGEWTQNSGATSQAADTTVSVTSTFGWTGGAINTSSNAATIKLSGVASAQIGEDHTMLSSGSNIVLDGLTTLNLAGVVNLPADRVIEVLEFANLNFRQIQAALPPGGNEPKVNRVLVKKGAARVFDNTTIDSLVVEQGGRVTVNAEKKLTVEGTIPNSQTVGVKIDEGTLTLGSGGELKSTAEVYLSKSTLLGVPDGDKATLDTFTITGDLGITETTITLTPVNVVDWSKLTITGDAKFNDGTFTAGVDADGVQKSDVIWANKFYTSKDFVIDVTPKDGNYTNGTNWDVLQSANGFNNETDIPKAKQPGYTTALAVMKKNLRVTG